MRHVSRWSAAASRAANPWPRLVRLLLLGSVLIALSSWTTAQGADSGETTTQGAESGGNAAPGAKDAYDGNLHFILTPYVWLPTINGAVRFRAPPGASGSPTFNFSVSPIDLLSHLDLGFMGAAEAREGNWSVFTDLMYLKLSGADAVVESITGPSGIVEIPVDAGSQFGLKGLIWTFAPSYTVYRTTAASIDVFAGFRDTQFTPSLKWNLAGPLDIFPKTGSFSEVIVAWDALIGAKGKIALSEDGQWFAPYYGDVGIGSKVFTWQALLGVGYTYPWGDLHFDYRALYYSPEKEIPLKHIIMHGPELTANLTF
jgi:hypothetical protein